MLALAGLQVGDRISVPGPGLRLRRAVLASGGGGGPLRESNWKRSVGWSAATAAAGLQGFRVHDLRHTAASVWLAAGADPKVVQRGAGTRFGVDDD